MESVSLSWLDAKSMQLMGGIINEDGEDRDANILNRLVDSPHRRRGRRALTSERVK